MPWRDIEEDLPETKLSKKEEAELESYLRTKKKKLRFYTDADVPTQAVEILREQRFNVLTAEEAGRKRHSDENHVAEARKQGRILITRDRDYMNERRFPLHKCPTIVVCNFGSGMHDQILSTFDCLAMIATMPDFYDEWVKIDANPSEWTETMRLGDGTTARNRHRFYQGELQVWVQDPAAY